MPAWKSPSSRATGTPHPGRCTFGWPKASCHVGGLGHGASRAIDEAGAMPVPPPFIQGRPLHRAAEALQEEVKEASREPRTGLAVGRRTAPQARQMGQMAAGRVTVQNLQQEAVHGGDRREDAVAPAGIPNLAAHSQDGVGLEQQGPLVGEALQDGSAVRNHLMTSCTIGMCIPQAYRTGLVAPNSREIPGPTACVLPNLTPFGFEPRMAFPPSHTHTGQWRDCPYR